MYLIQLLLLFSSLYGVMMSECNEIKPETILKGCDKSSTLTVYFYDARKTINSSNCDEEMYAKEILNEPSFMYSEADPNKKYATVMFHIDRDKKDNKFGSLNSVRYGIRGENLKKGDTTSDGIVFKPYCAPFCIPFSFSGECVVRLIFLVFELINSKIDYTFIETLCATYFSFSLDDFTRAAKLCGPVAYNCLIAKTKLF